MRTLSLKQAAAFLHISPSSLRGKVKSGLIPAAKPGKKWVFVEDDFVTYLYSLYARAFGIPRIASGSLQAKA